MLEKVRLFIDYLRRSPVCYKTLNTDSERKCLYKYLKNSLIYLEFGSGGSTFDAIKIMKEKGKIIYSVEGSEAWCDSLKKWRLIRDSIKTGKVTSDVYEYRPYWRLESSYRERYGGIVLQLLQYTRYSYS